MTKANPRAKVTAACFPNGIGNLHDMVKISTEMSTDLPAANLGELVADVLQATWRKGYDPAQKQFAIVINFE